MKDIRWSTQFSRRYKQRIAKNEQLTEEFWDSIDTFRINPALVDNHLLEDVMQGKRAFSINDEYRVVYIERNEYFLFLNVGTHEQIYRRS